MSFFLFLANCGTVVFFWVKDSYITSDHETHNCTVFFANLSKKTNVPFCTPAMHTQWGISQYMTDCMWFMVRLCFFSFYYLPFFLPWALLARQKLLSGFGKILASLMGLTLQSESWTYITYRILKVEFPTDRTQPGSLSSGHERFRLLFFLHFLCPM